MAKKKRANQQYEPRPVAIKTSPEYPDLGPRYPEVEQHLVVTDNAAHIQTVSTRSSRAVHAVVAGEVGSVNADLQTHQTSSFFPSSTGFEVSGGQFSSYRDHHSTGNVFINVNRSGNEGSVEVRESVLDRDRRNPQQGPHNSGFSTRRDENWLSEYSNTQIAARATTHSPPPPLLVQKSSEIYYRHLLTSGRGSPLWIPEPSNTLPIEYQRAGIGIGDVIILTDSGGADFLFNIYHPKGDSDHSINLPTMPEGYCPLDRPHIRDVSSHVEFKNNSFLASSLVNSRSDEESPGLIFESAAIDGAILTMPNGANSTDLKNKTTFRRYVRLNAERWYKYANEVCGRDARNGDIRLVVGKTSATTWGMATFANRSEQSAFRLKFKPTGNIGNGMGPATYGWEYSGMAEVKSGPDTHEVEKLRGDDVDGHLKVYENQCLFVRTVNVTLQDDVWDKLMVEWEKLDLDEDGASSESNSDTGQGSAGSHFSFGSSSAGTSSSSSNMNSNNGTTYGTRDWSGGTTRGAPILLTDTSGTLLSSPRRNRPRRPVHLSSFPPPIGRYHPSKIIHRLLLRERPHAKMAITEDEDWISVLDKNDRTFPTPNVLLSRIMTRYEIYEEEDVVFVMARQHPLVPMVSRPLAIMNKISSGITISQERGSPRFHEPASPWPWPDQNQGYDLADSRLEMYPESNDSQGTLRFIPPESWRMMHVATPPKRESYALLLAFLRSFLFPSHDLTFPFNSVWKGFDNADSLEIKRLIKQLSEFDLGNIRFSGKWAAPSNTVVNSKAKIVGTVGIIAPSARVNSRLMSLKNISNGATIPTSTLARYPIFDGVVYSPIIHNILDPQDNSWFIAENHEILPPLDDPRFMTAADGDDTGWPMKFVLSSEETILRLRAPPPPYVKYNESQTNTKILKSGSGGGSVSLGPGNNALLAFNNYMQSLGITDIHWTYDVNKDIDGPVWLAKLMVQNVLYGVGSGNTKKRARDAAARQAIAIMRLSIGDSDLEQIRVTTIPEQSSLGGNTMYMNV